ncbi:MAG: hypothetical protein JSW67_07705 [Candidatus Latescibacterota bacterium]|nr:MAG: hypothetical protein JSW67_07705 [Candidatus Latescibacterota bacterium]
MKFAFESHSSSRPSIGARVASRPARSPARPDLVRYVEPGNWHQRGPLGSVVLPREPQPEFVGAAACAECHRDRHKGFLRTNHFNTSRHAEGKTIKGSFEPGRNRLLTQKQSFYYEMQEREGGYYQVVFEGDQEIHRERFDIVVGSGKIAQTYLYWKDDALFELPVSYFTAMDSWVDSPGYPNGVALFSRPVQTRCVECHSTRFDGKYESPVNYRCDTQGFFLGVTCERCHGPGRDHVEFHRRNPDLETGKHVVNPGKLPRDRVNDICSQCHSSNIVPKKPPSPFVRARRSPVTSIRQTSPRARGRGSTPTTSCSACA